MIEIPESVTLKRDKTREAELYTTAREWLEKDERSPGIHASGLLDPLKAYWDTVNPGPLPDRLVTMFMVGKVLHAFVIGSYHGSVDINKTDEGSLVSTELGYTFSPDIYKNNLVREVKTSRAFFEPRTVDDVDNYVEQVLTYMAPTNTLEAELWVLFLNLRDDKKRTSPAFRCYTIRITQADLDVVKEKLAKLTEQLKAAIKAQDPTGLPLCREWKCGARNCEHYDLCQPEGRYGTPKWDAN